MCGSGGGRCEVTSAFPGGGARRPGPERQLGVLRPPAFGLWPEARPRVLAAVVDEQWGGGSAALGLWAPACGQWGPWATSPQRRHGLVTCAIYPCALAGPGQGQGYAGARVRVTFRVRVRVRVRVSRIGTAARSLDPVLLHPGFWERGSILQKKRHTFFLLVSVGFGSLRKETTRIQMMVREFHGRE